MNKSRCMTHAPTFSHSEHLAVLPGLTHGFFGRDGGVSDGLYASLNLGPGSNDDPEKVKQNRKIVADAMGAASMDHLISLYQIHSPHVVVTDRPFDWGARPEGDAMVTSTPGLALCVLTADCTPVLIADPVARVIGAAHAGWKGALSGVIENTIAEMVKLGASPHNMTAAIGPSLSQDSFEVGPDLKTPFTEKHDWSERFFRPGDGDRSQFDIWGFCEGILIREGVSKIDCLGEDTLTQPNRYFSNRWRVREKRSDYGRNGSVIMLTE